MTETKLVTPHTIFNELGNERFGKEWSNIPLKVLGSRKNTFKISSERYDRKKFMARQIWRELKDYLKHPDVIIYADTAAWDEDIDDSEFVKWGKPFRLSHSSDLLLIEKGTGKSKKLVKREFKIEMPEGKNPIVFKKAGAKPKHDKDYLKSILPEVLKFVQGKVTERSLSNAYKDYFKDGSVDAPSKTWVGNNLHTELKKIREEQ